MIPNQGEAPQVHFHSTSIKIVLHSPVLKRENTICKMIVCKMNGYSFQGMDMNVVCKMTVCKITVCKMIVYKMNGYNLQGMDKCSLQDDNLQGTDIDTVYKSM